MKIILAKSSGNIEHPSSSYHLSEAHQQAILAGTDNARQSRRIERQRQRFIQANGTDGLNIFNPLARRL